MSYSLLRRHSETTTDALGYSFNQRTRNCGSEAECPGDGLGRSLSDGASLRSMAVGILEYLLGGVGESGL